MVRVRVWVRFEETKEVLVRTREVDSPAFTSGGEYRITIIPAATVAYASRVPAEIISVKALISKKRAKTPARAPERTVATKGTPFRFTEVNTENNKP
jgi:hypothetical protein